MHFSVQMTMHILMGFRHVHLCTKDYAGVFVMHISVRMTIHILFVFYSFCTFLYEWLSISFCKDFRHAHFCTNDYPLPCVFFFYMHISIWMTIHILFVLVSSCTFAYIFIYVLMVSSSCTFLYEWPSTFFGIWCSSCTFLYEWLSNIFLYWVFVMFISVWMTFQILMGLRHAHLCTNDYPYSICIGFRLAHICTIDYPYSFGTFVMYIYVLKKICSQFLFKAFLLNGNREFLGVFSSNSSVSLCAQCSSTLE